MNPRRRNFLLGTAAAVGAASYGTLLAQADPAARNALRIPPLIDARQQRQGISLRAQAGRTEFFPGKESPTLGYNGNYLGPTLRVHRGDDVQVAVTNGLQEDTTVHWHGLLVPGDRDGGPHQHIAPGASWRPVLPVRQPGATLFYHSHVHGRTGAQVYAGLAGVLLVHDAQEDALGLPSDYGVDDLPLVIQDRQFAGGRMVLPNGMMTQMHGRRGNTLLVNGTPDAEVRVPARWVRLRLVNASNARIYRLAFADGRTFQWIASEGGLLAAPVALPSLSLAPGERAEVMVDFSDG
jgi:FtsP/CotA-like multicopper oxidase with cupredoxin domain